MSRPTDAAPTASRHSELPPLSLAIGVACALGLTLIWAMTLQRIADEREQAVAAAMESNANLAIAFEQQVYRTLKAAEQVASFAREQYLNHGDTLDLRRWETRGVIREAMFNIISIVDARGSIVRSSRLPLNVNYADREFFIAQRDITPDLAHDVLHVSQPVLGRVTNRWQIPMSLGMWREDGRFAGVVVVSVDPAKFTDFHRQANLGAGGLLELTGLDGTVRGRKIDEDRGFGMDAHDLPWFQRRAVAQAGSFVDNGSLDGVPRVISFRTMADYPLMVTVGTAFKSELAPSQARRHGYLWLAGGVSAGLMLFTVLLMLALSRQRAAAEALQTSEALFRATFHQAAMGIVHLSPEGRILLANEKFRAMLGYDMAELRERTIFEIGDPQRQLEARLYLRKRLSLDSADALPEMEKTYLRKDGAVLWVCEALGVVQDRQGRPERVVAVVQDITARKALEARLSHDALHDTLTGLPNRMMFHDRLCQVLESARRRQGLAAVLFLDLDGFKEVNDTLGHAAGDELLKQVALRLEECMRAEDTVARIGGDEFGVVLASVAQEGDCEQVATKILDALSQPFMLGQQEVRISASVGGALFPLHGQSMDSLLARADTGMYAAKHEGKGRFCWEDKESPIQQTTHPTRPVPTGPADPA
nr:diguanylate cyclase [Hylemonella gracilis]